VATDGTSRPLVVTSGSWAGRLTVADFRGPVRSLGRLKLGKFTDHRSPKVRRDVASALASSGIRPAGRAPRRENVEEIDLTVLRKAVRSHPVHGCADRDEHLQWARRWRRLMVENESLAASVASAKGSLGQALDEIIELLTERGYLRRDRLTASGKMLARIWSESDLVVAECLGRGIWEGLEPSDLAAVVSALVFESRREGQVTPRAPSGPAAEALSATIRVWAEISGRERAIGLPPTRDPDAGFAAAVAAWCRGTALADALAVAVAGGTDLSAGDFVRWCRQVIDLLDQVGTVAPDSIAAAARSAVGALRRGVVSMGSV